MRALVEALHLLFALSVTWLLGWLAIWAYPRAAADIWLVASVTMLGALLGGGYQLVKAVRTDRAGWRKPDR